MKKILTIATLIVSALAILPAQAGNNKKNKNKDRANELKEQAQNKLPRISLEIEFKYEDKDNLTTLSSLILDLDENDMTRWYAANLL